MHHQNLKQPSTNLAINLTFGGGGQFSTCNYIKPKHTIKSFDSPFHPCHGRVTRILSANNHPRLATDECNVLHKQSPLENRITQNADVKQDPHTEIENKNNDSPFAVSCISRIQSPASVRVVWWSLQLNLLQRCLCEFQTKKMLDIMFLPQQAVIWRHENGVFAYINFPRFGAATWTHSEYLYVYFTNYFIV